MSGSGRVNICKTEGKIRRKNPFPANFVRKVRDPDNRGPDNRGLTVFFFIGYYILDLSGKWKQDIDALRSDYILDCEYASVMLHTDISVNSKQESTPELIFMG